MKGEMIQVKVTPTGRVNISVQGTAKVKLFTAVAAVFTQPAGPKTFAQLIAIAVAELMEQVYSIVKLACEKNGVRLRITLTRAQAAALASQLVPYPDAELIDLKAKILKVL